MKSSRRVIDERRGGIMELLRRQGEVQVAALADHFAVSELTIRRDLDALEQQGLLTRRYGGAMIAAPGSADDPVYTCRHAIARKAASLVREGDTIFINSSSTALLIVTYLQVPGVTVITNNARIIDAERRGDLNIILLGGELRTPKGATAGEFAIANLSKVTANKSFLGCSGMTAEEGFTTEALQEVAINQSMLARVTGDRFVLADHRKIGKQHRFVSGAPGQFSCLITDEHADPAVLDALKSKGIRIILAPK